MHAYVHTQTPHLCDDKEGWHLERQRYPQMLFAHAHDAHVGADHKACSGFVAWQWGEGEEGRRSWGMHSRALWPGNGGGARKGADHEACEVEHVVRGGDAVFNTHGVLGSGVRILPLA
eukprot:29063-Chlamydomonas_euryale.AAC.1